MESLRPAGVAVSSTDNQKSVRSVGQSFGAELGHNLGRDTNRPIDFDFLVAQTFADAALEREVLQLFVAQVRKILPMLPELTAKEQADTAHLLKGSACGIGAWPAADAAAHYETTAPSERHVALPALKQAFAAAEAAIAARLATAST